MGFSPLRDEHAIELVGFACLLDRAVDENFMSRLRARHSEIRDVLPAVSASQIDGLIFGYLRPNGSPIWSLRLNENVIYAECSRYSRWEKIWNQARDLLLFGLSEAQGYSVSGIVLNVKDHFKTEADDFHLDGLFRHSTLLPHSVHERLAPWSVDQHWMENGHDNQIWNNLEVEARRRVIKAKNGERREFVAVTLEHQQQIEFETPLDIFATSGSLDQRIESAMIQMHHANKQMLDTLLVIEQQEKIGLWKA